MLIDSHTHLYLEQFDEDRDSVIERAIASGIEKFYLPNIDSGSVQAMLEMEKRYPDRCFPMMGLHPCSVREDYQAELEQVKEWLDKRPFCAIGEIGIDLYWDKSFLKEQISAFRQQIRWAKELEMPIVIHSRESIDLIIDIVSEEKDNRLRGIFHCFTGSEEQARKIMDLDFYMGIGGVLTFKNAGLDRVVRAIPLEHLVLETDAPYLTPAPHRGKRNESAYIKLIADKLAQVKSVDIEQVANVTTENVKKIFGKKSLAYTTV